MLARLVLVLGLCVALALGSAHWDLRYIASTTPPSSVGAVGARSLAYDYITRSVFVANPTGNRVDVFALTSTGALAYNTSIPSSTFKLGNVRNVAVHTGVLAVSLESPDVVSPGYVLFLDTSSFQILNQVKVGSGPGHMAWSRTGRRLLVANSGRPNDNYSVDPVGSVSIIRIGDTNEFNRVNFHLLQHSLNVTNLNFTSYTSINSIINSNNARINGINATIANSLEPSFITLNDFAYTPRAYVTCQINNVFIEIDLIKNKIVRLTALPFRDFSTKRNGFDASDADNAINIAQWPVKGIPGPYGAAFFFFNDRQYLAFANQGKARVNSAYNEQRVVKNVQLDPNRFNATQLQAPAALGDLVVSVNGADTNNDGKFDQLYAFGSRSISVWMLNTSSSDSQIYESGDSLERALAAANANTFNSAATNPTNTFDARSPYSGAEPSAVVIGKIGTKKLLFVALAQQSTIVAYSLSNPKIPRIVAYSGDYDANPSAPVDQQPADLIFIPNNRNNPTGLDLLVVANNLSGSTTVYQVARLDPPATPIPPSSWAVDGSR